MEQKNSEILEYIRENHVKFIRLGFSDPFGTQKKLSVMPDELAYAVENGIPFDTAAIRGLGDETGSDMFLHPDMDTFTMIPWRTEPGKVGMCYCDIRSADRTPFTRDSRYILRNVIRQGEDMGFTAKIGTECEFYLFKLGENGEPMADPVDRGSYLDVSPMDKGEFIRRDICLMLEEMGIKPESSYHEQGPGQNKINFQFSDPLRSADNFMTFKVVVKAVCSSSKIFASFMPKPISYTNPNSLVVNLSLYQNQENLFRNIIEGQPSPATGFLAGVMQRLPEITLFLNPIANSYERFGKTELLRYVSWSRRSRCHTMRIPSDRGEKTCLELHSPDPSLNPYLAFALLLASGFEGIEKGLESPASVEWKSSPFDRSLAKKCTTIPENMESAIRMAENSDLVRRVLGDSVVENYVAIKREEADAYTAAVDKDRFYRERYLGIV